MEKFYGSPLCGVWYTKTEVTNNQMELVFFSFPNPLKEKKGVEWKEKDGYLWPWYNNKELVYDEEQ